MYRNMCSRVCSTNPVLMNVPEVQCSTVYLLIFILPIVRLLEKNIQFSFNSLTNFTVF